MGDSSEISNPKPMKTLAYGGDRRGYWLVYLICYSARLGGGTGWGDVYLICQLTATTAHKNTSLPAVTK